MNRVRAIVRAAKAAVLAAIFTVLLAPAQAQETTGDIPTRIEAPEPGATPLPGQQLVSFGVHEVLLAPPIGFCPLDPRFGRDAELMANAELAQAGQNVVLVIYTPCPALAALRGGAITELPESVQIFSPTRFLQQALIGPGFERSAIVGPLADGWRQRNVVDEGLSIAADNAEDLGDMVQEQWLGVQAQTPDYVIAAVVLRLDPLDSEPFLVLTVTGATVLRGALITATLSRRVADPEEPTADMAGLSDKMAGYMGQLIALNEEGG